MDNQYLSISKILIIFAIGLCLYFICPKAKEAYDVYQDVQSKASQLQSTRSQIQEYKNKKEQYNKIEKANTKPIYKNDVEVNDRMSSFGIMFEDVIQSAKYNGLKLRSIEYNENPPGDAIAVAIPGDYNVCAIKMQLIGSYMQFRSYFQDIYNYPFVINLDKVSIKPYEKNKKVLIADITVTLYSAKTQAQKDAYAAEQAEAQKGDASDKKTSDTGVGDTVAAPQG